MVPTKKFLAALTVVFTCLAMASAPSDFSGESAGKKLLQRVKFNRQTRVLYFPPDTSEKFDLAKNELLVKQRVQLIAGLRRLLREMRGENQRYELSLRLGRLYLETYYTSMEASLYIKNGSGARKKQAKNTVKLMESVAPERFLQSAITLYEGVKKGYPKGGRTDEVLYFLSLALQDAGKQKEAVRELKLLSENYPKSPFAANARVELGDYYFLVNEMETAAGYYDIIIKANEPRFVAYATYKRAWCSFNRGDFTTSLRLFKSAIAAEDGSEENRIRIRKEALHDIALPYVELNRISEAVAFFSSHGDPYFHDGLELMAVSFLERQRYSAAINLWEELLKGAPSYTKNHAYEIQIVNALDLAHNRKGAVSRLSETLPRYLGDSSWREVNRDQVGVLEAAAKQLEESVRQYALNYHAIAQRTKDESLYGSAEKLYLAYVEYFSGRPFEAEVRIHLGDLQERGGHHLAAADNYYRAYELAKNNREKESALRLALSALDQELNEERRSQGLAALSVRTSAKLKGDSTEAAVPYSPLEERLMKTAREYLAKFPKASDAADALYETSYLQYSHHDFDVAQAGFNQILERYPSHATNYSSAHLILDVLNRRKDFPGLITACQGFLRKSNLSSSGFRSEVADILRHAELKRIQATEEKGDHRAAADAYLAYTRTYGGQDEKLFERALYNAGVNYSKAGAPIEALDCQEKFLRRFGKSALAEPVLVQAGKGYEAMGKFAKAAEMFERFADRYPQAAGAKEALRWAGLYHWASNEPEKAAKVLNKFIKQNPAEGASAEKELLAIYESEGNIGKRVAYHDAQAKQATAPVRIVYHMVKAIELIAGENGRPSTKRLEAALKQAEKTRRALLKDEDGAECYAKLQFWSANEEEKKFYGVRLGSKASAMAEKLKLKLDALKDLEKQYGKIRELGSAAYGLASLYRTALAYQDLAGQVEAAPVPANLPGDQLEAYRAEIKKTLIDPFRSKAQNLVERCLDKSEELKSLSLWGARCYSMAVQLIPDKFPGVRTAYLPPLEAVALTAAEETKAPEARKAMLASPVGFLTLLSEQPRAKKGRSNAFAAVPRNEGPDSGLIPFLYVRAEEGERAPASEVDKKRSYSSEELAEVFRKAPKQAVGLVLQALEKTPGDASLHNLLGLSYLESGNRSAARVTWLSLLSRSEKSFAVLNNLGVLASLEGRDEEAAKYFAAALTVENRREALINLGSIYLKFRLGSEAKRYFEQALKIDAEDRIAQAGRAVAEAQERKIGNASEHLSLLNKTAPDDFYAALSLAYVMMEGEGKFTEAKAFLSEYVEGHSLANDSRFQTALQESGHVMKKGSDGLPSIE